jgi:hypothetical protein
VSYKPGVAYRLRAPNSTTYFRFDPDGGIGDVPLDDIYRGSEMQQAIHDYLQTNSVQLATENCARALKAAHIKSLFPEARSKGATSANGYCDNFLKVFSGLGRLTSSGGQAAKFATIDMFTEATVRAEVLCHT